LNRFSLAFRSFFNILFSGTISDGVLNGLRLTRRMAAASTKPSAAPKPAPAAAPAVRASDGALQLLSILQRDARLVDFLMEDIAGYSDDQVGAAVRGLHDQCRDSLGRAVVLEPVIDGVEGTFAKAPSADPNVVKFIGNVPAKPPAGGTLRHKGWKAVKVNLPALAGRDAAVIAPAEIEIE
jgi:hypothetical protein